MWRNRNKNLVQAELIGLLGLMLIIGCQPLQKQPGQMDAEVSSRPIERSVRGYVPEITNFKARQTDLANLKANEKCVVNRDTVLQFKSAPAISGDHLKVEMTHALAGCSFTKGFFYIKHLKTDDYTITITADTFLKSGAVAQTALSATEKCFINPSVIPVMAKPNAARGSHYFIKLL
jgi:hypothetical protein